MIWRNLFRESPLCRPLSLLAVAFLVACSDDKSTADKPSASPSPESSSRTSTGNTPPADQSTARYFVNTKSVAPASASAPAAKGDLSFTLDIADVKDRTIRIRGWGFRIAPPHQKDDRVTVLLVGADTTYSAVADVELRPDVSAVLKQAGLDDTGFVCLINAATIKPGEYTIFLRIGGADGQAIKSTNRTLTL